MAVFWFVLTVVASILLVLWWMRRGPEHRSPDDKPAIGYLTSFCATIYIVLLALIIVVQWQYVDTVDGDVRAEASYLRQLVEAADRLPATDGGPIRAAAADYATAVTGSEWPPEDTTGAPAADAALARVRTLLTTPKNLGDSVGSIGDQGLATVDAIDTTRQDRLATSGRRVPTALLVLLVVFSIVTVVTPLALGIEADAFTVVGMALMVVTVCAALWFAFDLTAVYSGTLKASDKPLRAFLAHVKS